MSNRSDEELILSFYGEHPDPEAMAADLAADPALRQRLAELTRDLGALAAVEPPEPRPGLEQRLWARLRPELDRPPSRRAWPGLPTLRWAWSAAAVLGLLALGFLAGRQTARRATPVAVPSEREASAAPSERQASDLIGALPAAARQRVLAAALTEHLESSERLLVQVSNDSSALAEERRWAAALLDSNRLYRLAAERAGQRRVAALLGELEPLFAELANPTGETTPADLRAAREQISEQDLLFKVRITRSNL